MQSDALEWTNIHVYIPGIWDCVYDKRNKNCGHAAVTHVCSATPCPQKSPADSAHCAVDQFALVRGDALPCALDDAAYTHSLTISATARSVSEHSLYPFRD